MRPLAVCLLFLVFLDAHSSPSPKPLAHIVITKGQMVKNLGSGLQKHNVKSLSKSLIAILLGIAKRDGLIENLDEDITPLLWPERKVDKLTWRQLLMMHSGFPSTSGPNYAKWVNSRNWVEYFLRQPRKKPASFSYSTGDSHLLAVALRKKIGRSLESYAKEKLFSPLQGKNAEWESDPQGNEFGGNNLLISSAGVARIGQMLLQNGAWQGKQIVDPDWIKQMWQKKADAPQRFVEFEVLGYGYFWWLVRVNKEEGFCALGYGGQLLCLFPNTNTLIVLFFPAPKSSQSASKNWKEIQRFLEADLAQARAKQ